MIPWKLEVSGGLTGDTGDLHSRDEWRSFILSALFYLCLILAQADEKVNKEYCSP